MCNPFSYKQIGIPTVTVQICRWSLLFVERAYLDSLPQFINLHHHCHYHYHYGLKYYHYRALTGFGKFWKSMEIDNAILQDLESLGKGTSFKMAIETSWIFVREDSTIS